MMFVQNVQLKHWMCNHIHIILISWCCFLDNFDIEPFLLVQLRDDLWTRSKRGHRLSPVEFGSKEKLENLVDVLEQPLEHLAIPVAEAICTPWSRAWISPAARSSDAMDAFGLDELTWIWGPARGGCWHIKFSIEGMYRNRERNLQNEQMSPGVVLRRQADQQVLWTCCCQAQWTCWSMDWLIDGLVYC